MINKYICTFSRVVLESEHRTPLVNEIVAVTMSFSMVDNELNLYLLP